VIEDYLTEEVEARLGDLARVFNQDIDSTEWSYAELMYQAFRARMQIEAEIEQTGKLGGGS
jgi:hypothetical protein